MRMNEIGEIFGSLEPKRFKLFKDSPLQPIPDSSATRHQRIQSILSRVVRSVVR